MMDVNLASAIFSNISDQLRKLREAQSDGVENILKRLDSIEKDVKNIKEQILNNSCEKSQKVENFTIFPSQSKTTLPSENVILTENKEKYNEFMLDDNFVFSSRKNDNDLESFDKYIEKIALQSNNKEMNCFTLPATTLKEIDSRLYIKSNNEIKPSEVGQVTCSLSNVDGGKILEITNKSLLTTSKIFFTNTNLDEIEKKDGKKYIAIIFPDKSFSQLEGSKLNEFYLKFTNKEDGMVFYEKIKRTEIM